MSDILMIYLIFQQVWGMAGFSRGQGVPLHRGLHQLVASTNPNKLMLYRLFKSSAQAS